MDNNKLKSIIESLLFYSGDPMSLSKISQITQTSEEEIEKSISELQNEYTERKSGLILIRKENEVQISTNPQNADILNHMIKSELQENLSRSALEVLSIVAYRGPIARVSIEAVRGVNCSFTLRSLLMRGLVERIGNPKDSRGYLYKISFDFLQKLGLDSVSKLPDFESLSRDERIESIIVN